MNKKVVFFVAAILTAVFILTGCTTKKEVGKIRLGVLPDINSVPFIVAVEEGIFAKYGVEVEAVYFNSARERDQALQAEAIDASNSDILNVIFLNEGGFPVKATSTTVGSYTLVAAPGRQVSSPPELRGMKVGLSQNTIIEFVIDRILEKHGLTPEEIEKEYIADMPLRREMLIQGNIDAAGLPEPLGSLSVARGGLLVAESNEEGIMPGVLLFRQEVLADRPEDVRMFYRAYAEAIELVNEEITVYLPLIVEKLRFPEELLDRYVFPEYTAPLLPDAMEVDAALSWVISRGLIEGDYSYTDLVEEGLFTNND